MNNLLSFSLGLETALFDGALGDSASEVLSFAALAEVVRSAWDHTWEAIGKGAELKALASATGESVSQLYKLQHGLEAIGASAENPNMLLMMTQKALSGVNEQGIQTGILFQKLGLDLTKLRSQDTVQSLMEIGTALGKLSPNQAAGAGEMLFGRFQTQTVLQMARDMKGFQEGMNSSSTTGALLDKFSSTFEQVKADWGDIESDVLGIWVVIAGKVAPVLETIFTKTEHWLHGIEEAFASGRIGEILKLELIVAIEYGASFLENLFGNPRLWTGMWDVMKGTFIEALAAMRAASVVQFATMATLAEHILQPGMSISKLFEGNMKMFNAVFGASDLAKQGAADIAEGSRQIGKAGSDAWKNAHAKDQAQLTALLNSIGLGNLLSTGGTGSGGSGLITPMGNKSHPEFTNLEKMGFVFASGGRVGNPYDQRKVDLLQSIDSGVKALGNHTSNTGINPPNTHWS